MSTNLKYSARERQGKRESRRHRRPAKLNEKKGDRDLEGDIKNKGDEKKREHVRHFLHKKVSGSFALL